MVLDNHCAREYPPTNTQPRLFSRTRASDGEFQSAVAKLNGASFAAGSAAGFGLAVRLRAEVLQYQMVDSLKKTATLSASCPCTQLNSIPTSLCTRYLS